MTDELDLEPVAPPDEEDVGEQPEDRPDPEPATPAEGDN